MNSRGWETVAELPTGKAKNVGYREAGAPDPIVADERWRNPLIYLRLWLRSGPDRPWPHTARACVLTERHLYATRMNGKSSRVSLGTMTAHRRHADGSLAIAIEDGADVLLPRPGRPLTEALAAWREEHAVPFDEIAAAPRTPGRRKLTALLLVAPAIVMLVFFGVRLKRARIDALQERCASAKTCASEGKCGQPTTLGIFPDGSCRPTSDEHCATSMLCARSGRCSLHKRRCQATKADDCMKSTNCAKQGRCTLTKPLAGRAQECVQDTGHCRIRSECADEGLCSPSSYGSTCRATVDADCKPSKACTKHERCRARMGKCVRSCRDSDFCRQLGHCEDNPPPATTSRSTKTAQRSCVATQDADCKASTSCKKTGKCSLGKYNCKAKNDADCRASTDCKETGQCQLGKYGCIAGKDADCKTTKRCAEWGWCTAVKGNCRAGNDADCKPSSSCLKWGRCTAVKGMCRVKSDADCKLSMFCERWGRCTHHAGSCVKQKIAPTEGPLEKRSGPVR